MSEQNAVCEGWAIVEMFGHGREIGYVTTQYFGSACLFQIDVPELPEREVTLKRPQFLSTGEGRDAWVPAGAKVKKQEVAARTRMIGPASIFALNPCSEEAARTALDEFVPRKYVVIELPKEQKPLLPGEVAAERPVCFECGALPENGHEDYCTVPDIEDDE